MSQITGIVDVQGPGNSWYSSPYTMIETLIQKIKNIASWIFTQMGELFAKLRFYNSSSTSDIAPPADEPPASASAAASPPSLPLSPDVQEGAAFINKEVAWFTRFYDFNQLDMWLGKDLSAGMAESLLSTIVLMSIVEKEEYPSFMQRPIEGTNTSFTAAMAECRDLYNSLSDRDKNDVGRQLLNHLQEDIWMNPYESKGRCLLKMTRLANHLCTRNPLFRECVAIVKREYIQGR